MTDDDSVREAVYSSRQVTHEEWSLSVPATPEEISRMDHTASSAREFSLEKAYSRVDVTPLVYGIRDGMITVSYTYVYVED